MGTSQRRDRSFSLQCSVYQRTPGTGLRARLARKDFDAARQTTSKESSVPGQPVRAAGALARFREVSPKWS